MSFLSLCVIFICFCVTEIIAQIPLKSPHETKGVVLLDAFTFPKLVPSPTLTFVVLVANKRKIGDYATDSIRADFFALSDYVQTQDESDSASKIVFAQIIVNGAENARIAEDMGMDKDSTHPRMFLFVPGQSSPIPYPKTSPFQLQIMLRFIAQNTDFKYELPGILAKYSGLVKSVVEFIYGFNDVTANRDAVTSFEGDPTFQKFLDEANTIHEQYSSSSEELPIQYSGSQPQKNEKKSEKLTVPAMSSFYVKTLEGIAKSGSSYVKKEIDRIRPILENKKLSPVTQTKVTYQLNILKSFLNSREVLSKEEVRKIQNTPGRSEF